MSRERKRNIVVMRGQEALCLNCGATYDLWPGGQPQPIGAVAALSKWFTAEHAKCPTSGRPAIEAKLEAERVEASRDPMAWALGPDTGTSSLTIWSVITGRPSPHGRYDAPHDPSDFGRCYRLLQAFPAWRARLDEVAARVPVWAPLVREWDALVALYEREVKNESGMAPDLYAAIERLRAEVETWRQGEEGR